MPSPIAHVAAGYVIYKVYTRRYPEKARERIGPYPSLLAVTIGLSLLPDLDFIPGLIVNDLSRYHNHFSHSFFLGLVVALGVGLIAWLTNRSSFTFWFFLTLICYQVHVLMDFFTVGRGLMIFWPFSLERYQPPVMLFYGLHRSNGWISIRHLWTFLTESAFAVGVFLVSGRLSNGKSRDGRFG